MTHWAEVTPSSGVTGPAHRSEWHLESAKGCPVSVDSLLSSCDGPAGPHGHLPCKQLLRSMAMSHGLMAQGVPEFYSS